MILDFIKKVKRDSVFEYLMEGKSIRLWNTWKWSRDSKKHPVMIKNP